MIPLNPITRTILGIVYAFFGLASVAMGSGTDVHGGGLFFLWFICLVFFGLSFLMFSTAYRQYQDKRTIDNALRGDFHNIRERSREATETHIEYGQPRQDSMVATQSQGGANANVAQKLLTQSVGRGTVESIDNLIEVLEVLRGAIRSKDKDTGFDAVTILLMQFMETFGHSQAIVAKTFPVLEELKDHIQAGEFDEASPVALALLLKFRQVKDAIEHS